jgi:hypothetical protein
MRQKYEGPRLDNDEMNGWHFNQEEEEEAAV